MRRGNNLDQFYIIGHSIHTPQAVSIMFGLIRMNKVIGSVSNGCHCFKCKSSEQTTKQHTGGPRKSNGIVSIPTLPLFPHFPIFHLQMHLSPLLLLLLFDLCPLRVHLSANCSHVTDASQFPSPQSPISPALYLYIAFCKHLIFQLCRTIELQPWAFWFWLWFSYGSEPSLLTYSWLMF